MNESIVEYLTTLKVPTHVVQRLEAIHDFYWQFCPEPISDVFITDLVREDGNIEYVNLWFFSESICMEAKEFISKDNFDMMPIRRQIFRWAIEKTGFDGQSVNENSRMKLSFQVEPFFGGEMNASRENCRYLMMILKKYILPQMIDGKSTS